VGSTVPHSGGLFEQAGIRFPGCVRRSTWRGFAFDPGARGASEHLMPWSGGAGGASRAEGGLERSGDSPEGPGPSSEVETRRRGAMPSNEAGSFAVRCPPLERDGGWPEGYWGWRFGGPVRPFGSWALFVFGLQLVRDMICSCVLDYYF
jgi:hypothetical protein